MGCPWAMGQQRRHACARHRHVHSWSPVTDSRQPEVYTRSGCVLGVMGVACGMWCQVCRLRAAGCRQPSARGFACLGCSTPTTLCSRPPLLFLRVAQEAQNRARPNRQPRLWFPITKPGGQPTWHAATRHTGSARRHFARLIRGTEPPQGHRRVGVGARQRGVGEGGACGLLLGVCAWGQRVASQRWPWARSMPSHSPCGSRDARRIMRITPCQLTGTCLSAVPIAARGASRRPGSPAGYPRIGTLSPLRTRCRHAPRA